MGQSDSRKGTRIAKGHAYSVIGLSESRLSLLQDTAGRGHSLAPSMNSSASIGANLLSFYGRGGRGVVEACV